MKQLKKALLRRFLDSYKQNKLKNSNTTVEHGMATTKAMLADAKYCFLITQGEGGRCSTRLIQPIVDLDNMLIWIGTNPELRKVKEISKNRQVALAFENKKEDSSLVLYGNATIDATLENREKFWKFEWRLFFPNGPQGEDYVVIRVEPTKIELMNFKRNVVQEPFGLKPIILEKTEGCWRTIAGENK